MIKYFKNKQNFSKIKTTKLNLIAMALKKWHL